LTRIWDALLPPGVALLPADLAAAERLRGIAGAATWTSWAVLA